MSAAPSVPESSLTAEAARAGLLYERYSSRILGYCRSRLRSREEAEDAVQHTFLNAYRSLRGGVVPHAEAAWLFKIAANVCHERRRSAWRRSRIEAVSDDGELREAVAPPTSVHDELAGLADALAQLTPNQRRAILLREWQGLSYREIAAELGTTEAAVETLLFRARRSLARKLDRRRARAGFDLGSLLAWIQSFAGGAAVKVAAATVVTAASVTVATPALRSHASEVHATPVNAPAILTASASLRRSSPALSLRMPRASSGPRPSRRRSTTARRRTVRATPLPPTAARETIQAPERTEPARASAAVPPVPVQQPSVRIEARPLPPAPALPVQVPLPPPIVTETVPALPSVSTPALPAPPELPKLP
jgi:RNA polymerase sigma factor (sigma-70 family)